MKAYGYKKDSEDLIELQELSLKCSLEELDNVIKFLSDVKEQHSKASKETDSCHSHLRDWDKKWTKEQMDIIVFTEFKKYKD